MLGIPKILHTYWGGGKLVYLRYLTIKTFIDLNPEWEVYFWYPVRSFTGKSWGIEKGYQEFNEKLCKDYLPDLLELPITKMPIDFAELHFNPSTAEVHKADFIRINALYFYGGAWSDMDILYFKPIISLESLGVNTDDKEVFVCISPEYGHSTGFNLARPQSRFFDVLIHNLNEEYRPGNYQCWGPDMFNKYFKTIESIPGGFNLPMDIVYAHNCYHTKELISDKKPRFTKRSIGCHWYGGNSIWGGYLNETGGGESNLKNDIISNLIRDIKNGK